MTYFGVDFRVDGNKQWGSRNRVKKGVKIGGILGSFWEGISGYSGISRGVQKKGQKRVKKWSKIVKIPEKLIEIPEILKTHW